MVTKYLFKDRDGRTPLPEDFKKDLIPKHIQTGGELDEYEEANIVEGLVWLDGRNDDCVDYLFWKRLHKKLFQNVWTWAGNFRGRELANPDFDHPGYIQEHIRGLEGDLKCWLERKSFRDDKEIVARFQERFLTIHPFMNGNGRTSRILTEYICKKEGLPVPTWGQSLKADPTKHRQTYLDAINKARHKLDYTKLIDFMYS